MIVKAEGKREVGLGYLFVIGGPGASGSSTIAKLLARRYGLKRIYGGDMMRQYAKAMGMAREDFVNYISENNLGEEYDKKIDSKLIKYSYLPNILIESKIFAALCTKFRIPTTVRIWIDASPDVRAMREFMKNGITVDKSSVEYQEVLKKLERRFQDDSERYKKLYGVDYSDQKLYNDIVIDSSNLNEHQTLSLVIKLLNDGGYITE